jgi:hypothetical protein
VEEFVDEVTKVYQLKVDEVHQTAKENQQSCWLID